MIMFHEDNTISLPSDDDKRSFTNYVITGFVGGLLLALFYEGNPLEHSFWETFFVHPLRTIAIMIAAAPTVQLLLVLNRSRRDIIPTMRRNPAVKPTTKLLIEKPIPDISSQILGMVERSVSQHPGGLMLFISLFVLLPGVLHWTHFFIDQAGYVVPDELETWKYLPTCGTICLFVLLDKLRHSRASGVMLLSFRLNNNNDARSHFVEEFPTEEKPKVRN
jgi:hypothetical protein